MYAPYLEALERGPARARRSRTWSKPSATTSPDSARCSTSTATSSTPTARSTTTSRSTARSKPCCATPDVRRAFQREARHLLVDEFQDLTPAQLLLLRLVAAPAYDVFGVGDDDQVIYGYAGADPEFLINYDRYFPGGTHHALATNYRCPEPVVAATRNLLSYNRRRIDKEIVAAKSGSTPTPSRCTVDRDRRPERLAHAAVERVTAWLEAGAQPHEIAVLGPRQLRAPPRATPARRSGRAVLDAGERRGAQPDRHAHRARVPPARARGREQHRFPRRRSRARGAPPEPLAAARGAAATRTQAGVAHAHNCGGSRRAERTRRGRSSTCSATISTRSARRSTTARPPTSCSRGSATTSGSAPRSPPSTSRARPPTPATATTSTRSSRSPRSNPIPPRSSPGCAPGCAPPNERAADEGVALSTVHRVKGMEWPFVVVLGAHDGLMPHALADDIEEERRIFHVAITRGDTAVQVIADATRPAARSSTSSWPRRARNRRRHAGRTAAAVEAPPSRGSQHHRRRARPPGRRSRDRADRSSSCAPTARVLEEPSGTRVVIPYGERVELDGRRAAARAGPIRRRHPRVPAARRRTEGVAQTTRRERPRSRVHRAQRRGSRRHRRPPTRITGRPGAAAPASARPSWSATATRSSPSSPTVRPESTRCRPRPQGVRASSPSGPVVRGAIFTPLTGRP